MVHAVVAIFELLFVLSRAGIMRGCAEKVVTPLKVEVEVPVPIAIDPVVKLAPIVMAEVTELAFMTFTHRVDTLRTEEFAVEKDCTAFQVFGTPFTYVQNVLVHAVVAILEVLSVLSRACIMRGCVEKVCIPDQVFEFVFT